MNNFPSQETVERYRKQYPAGTTVMLDAMPDDPHPVPSGTLGTVTAVDDAGQVHVRWRNGSSLAVIPGHDSFHVVQPEQDYVLQLQKKLEKNLAECELKRRCRRNYSGRQSRPHMGILTGFV